MATFAKHGSTPISAEEVKSDMDGPLPPKRKPEVMSPDRDNIQEEMGDDLNKKQKLETPSVDEKEPLLPDVESCKSVSEAENIGIQLNKEVEEEEEEEEEEEDDEDEEDYADEDSEDDENSEDDAQSNGGPVVNDPKGKGILKDEKGKGKLIVESEEDSSDSGSESDSESDLSDDPLIEVDMNNILPSRTRRRASRPGVNVSNKQASKGDRDNGDDSTC